LAGTSRWNGFLAAGYAVCIGDYRGHPDGQPFTVLRGDVNATDDVAAIVKSLGATSSLDTHRLAVMGNSLGGVTTLQAVSSGKISPSCIVLKLVEPNTLYVYGVGRLVVWGPSRGARLPGVALASLA
jgi:alpha-beta hydrolase superfamily lysophospholipase